jgi:hypothetical protein
MCGLRTRRFPAATATVLFICAPTQSQFPVDRSGQAQGAGGVAAGPAQPDRAAPERRTTESSTGWAMGRLWSRKASAMPASL